MKIKHLLPCFYLLRLALTKPIHPALEQRQPLTITIDTEPLSEITTLLTDLPNPTDFPTRLETFDIPPSLQCVRVVRATIGETCRDIARAYNIAYDVALSRWLNDFPALSRECQSILRRYSICLRESPGSSSAVASSTPSSMPLSMSSSSFAAGSSFSSTLTTTLALNTTLTFTLGSGSSTRVTSVVVTRTATITVPGSASSIPSSGAVVPSSLPVAPSSVPVITSSVPIISSSVPFMNSSMTTFSSWSKYVTTSPYSTKYTDPPRDFLAEKYLAIVACNSVNPPATIQEGIIHGCTKWHVAQPGDSCYTVTQIYAISTEAFMAWNPAVSPPTCQRMLAGLAYCVGTGVSRQSSLSHPACPSFLDNSETAVTSNAASTTPSLDSPTTASSTRGSATSQRCSSQIGPPAPTGDGTVQGCTLWYIAQLGDSCYSIANAFHLANQLFMDRNPSVMPPTCLNLLAGHVYCVEWCDDTPGFSSFSAITTTITSSSVLTTHSSFSSTIYNTSASATVPVPSSAAPSFTTSPSDKYVSYCGDGSVAAGWPSMSDWLDFEYLFNYNRYFMQMACQAWGVPDDSPEEIEDLRTSILSVSDLSGVDARFILATVMQESTGCVRVITSQYSHANPGLMQSFNGTGTCNTNSSPLGLPGVADSGTVWTPCPASRIEQQILDGANGTIWGPGLRQDLAQARSTTNDLTQAYYRAARIYNGGTFVADDLSQPCCTTSYVSDIANRLLGWRSAPRTYSCGA